MSDENKLYTNVGVWLALGAGIGVAIGAALSALKGRKDKD
jgi:hypothetical protein